ncbi:MAG: 5'-nucleotidase C-terminal domain-containing protein [Cyanobacteriota bacterium]|nr:5'-nucleotidase C-terminal domain-containing protein [Cyanobacteriota bacterium]
MPLELQILHASDQEAGLPAIQDAVNFSAVMNALEDDFDNTLKLSSGDLYIPGAFFTASDTIYGEPGIADVLINDALGFKASALGNHEFDLGTEVISNLIRANPDITGPGIGDDGYLGTQYANLSTNLDFSADANLADLVVESGNAPQANSITSSTVIDVGGEEIGIVGATTPALASLSSPGDVAVSPQDSTDIPALAEEIQLTVDALTDTGINKVVLLSHMQQISIEEELAGLLENVDVIMAGGSNTILADDDDRLRVGDSAEGNYPIELTSASDEPVVLINTDGNYRYVGRLAVNFDDDGIIDEILEETGIYATDDEGVEFFYGEDVEAEEVADPVVVEVTAAIDENVSSRDGNIFGGTDVFLNGTRGDVRTEETNLGNLSSDANLFVAQQYDETVTVSIKNAGGIRDNIGTAIVPSGSNSGELEKLPPAANPEVGKEEGDISQLDIENSLRFNNELSLASVTAEELRQIVEHGVAATSEGASPGQFPQIGGIAFSFDPTGQAIAFDRDADGIATGLQTEGDRVRSLAILNEDGSVADEVVRDGEVVGDASREIRLVTLSFLAGGGDAYPFPLFAENIVNLADEELPAGASDNADFTDSGSEQDALAEYLNANFAEDNYSEEDVAPAEDERIQNLSAREDTVLEEEAEPEPTALLLTNDADVETLSPGDLDDFPDGLRALGGSDRITGSAAAEVINGNGGNDTLNGAGGGDRLIGGFGNDWLYGKNGNDVLEGRPGIDRLFGGNGNDVLDGGIGRDRLNGGAGNDTMTGGASRDRFIFNTNSAYAQEDLGVDEITDFAPGEDSILLDRTTFAALQDIATEFETVTSDDAAATAEGIIVYSSNSGNLYYNPNGSDADLGDGGQFATLTGAPNIGAEDFLVRA